VHLQSEYSPHFLFQIDLAAQQLTETDEILFLSQNTLLKGDNQEIAFEDLGSVWEPLTCTCREVSLQEEAALFIATRAMDRARLEAMIAAIEEDVDEDMWRAEEERIVYKECEESPVNTNEESHVRPIQEARLQEMLVATIAKRTFSGVTALMTRCRRLLFP